MTTAPEPEMTPAQHRRLPVTFKSVRSEVPTLTLDHEASGYVYHVAIDAANGERWFTTENYSDKAGADRSIRDAKVALLTTLITDVETLDQLDEGTLAEAKSLLVEGW